MYESSREAGQRVDSQWSLLSYQMKKFYQIMQDEALAWDKSCRSWAQTGMKEDMVAFQSISAASWRYQTPFQPHSWWAPCVRYTVHRCTRRSLQIKATQVRDRRVCP